MLSALLFNILAPILLMVGLGALVRHKFKINVDTLSKVNIYLFTPAFIFDRVWRSDLRWENMAGIASVTAMCVVSLGIIVWIIGRVRNIERRRLAALAMAAMFYNSGNFGLPLAELAYPHGVGMKDGAAVQTFVVLTQNVLTFTLGLAIAAGANAHAPLEIARRMFSMPVLYTLAAALIGKQFFGPGTDWFRSRSSRWARSWPAAPAGPAGRISVSRSSCG